MIKTPDMFVNKTRIKNLRNFFLVLLSSFLIMPYGMLSVVTIAFAALSIFVGWEKKKFNKTNLKEFLRYTMFFFILFFSVFYSQNFERGFSIIGKMSPLIIFPFLFVFMIEELDKIIYRRIKYVFFSSVIIAILIVLYYAFIELRIVGFEKIFYWSTLARATKSVPFLDFHPNYISLYISLCIYFIYDSRHIAWVVKMVLILIMTAFIILLSSRAVFISIVISFICVLLLFVKANIKAKISISLVILCIGIYFIRTNDYIYTDIKLSDLNNSEYQIESETPSSYEIRIVIINCFLKVVSGEYLLGVGVGDLQDNLNDCYSDRGEVFMKDDSYNTHNNYLFFLGSSGFFCLGFFVYMMGYEIRKVFKNKKVIAFMMLVTLSIALMFENILVRSYGVTFFSYFFLIFYLEQKTQVIKVKYYDKG